MTKFDKKKVHPQILRNYLDIKHERWLMEYFPWILLGAIFGAIGIVALIFAIQPRLSISALMVIGALLLAITPYVALVFLAPGRKRPNILLSYLAAIAFMACVMAFLSWLMPNGHF